MLTIQSKPRTLSPFISQSLLPTKGTSARDVLSFLTSTSSSARHLLARGFQPAMATPSSTAQHGHVVYVKPEPGTSAAPSEVSFDITPSPSERWTTQEESDLMSCVKRYGRKNWPLIADAFDRKQSHGSRQHRTILSLKRKYQEIRDEAVRKKLGAQAQPAQSDLQRLAIVKRDFNKAITASSTSPSDSGTEGGSDSESDPSWTPSTALSSPRSSTIGSQAANSSGSHVATASSSSSIALINAQRTSSGRMDVTTQPSVINGMKISHIKNGLHLEGCPLKHRIFIYSRSRVQVVGPGQQAPLPPSGGQERPLYTLKVHTSGWVEMLKVPDCTSARIFRHGTAPCITRVVGSSGYRLNCVAEK